MIRVVGGGSGRMRQSVCEEEAEQAVNSRDKE